MKDILVATINDEILKDYKFILKGYNVLGMRDVGIDVDIEETGWTFLNNAWLKAYFVNDYIYNRDKKYFDSTIEPMILEIEKILITINKKRFEKDKKEMIKLYNYTFDIKK